MSLLDTFGWSILMESSKSFSKLDQVSKIFEKNFEKFKKFQDKFNYQFLKKSPTVNCPIDSINIQPTHPTQNLLSKSSRTSTHTSSHQVNTHMSLLTFCMHNTQCTNNNKTEIEVKSNHWLSPARAQTNLCSHQPHVQSEYWAKLRRFLSAAHKKNTQKIVEDVKEQSEKKNLCDCKPYNKFR